MEEEIELLIESIESLYEYVDELIHKKELTICQKEINTLDALICESLIRVDMFENILEIVEKHEHKYTMLVEVCEN